MNKFGEYLQSCVGKTIAKAEGAVINNGEDSVRFTFTDETTITLYIDHDTCESESIGIQEIDSKPKFTTSYSPLRGQLYVYNEKSDVAFILWDDELPDGLKAFDQEEVTKFLKKNYSDLLDEHGLL